MSGSGGGHSGSVVVQSGSSCKQPSSSTRQSISSGGKSVSSCKQLGYSEGQSVSRGRQSVSSGGQSVFRCEQSGSGDGQSGDDGDVGNNCSKTVGGGEVPDKSEDILVVANSDDQVAGSSEYVVEDGGQANGEQLGGIEAIDRNDHNEKATNKLSARDFFLKDVTDSSDNRGSEEAEDVECVGNQDVVNVENKKQDTSRSFIKNLHQVRMDNGESGHSGEIIMDDIRQSASDDISILQENVSMSRENVGDTEDDIIGDPSLQDIQQEGDG